MNRHSSNKLYIKSNVITAVFCPMYFPLSGILVNKDGVPEEEENFGEAIKAVNSALVPTKVI